MAMLNLEYKQARTIADVIDSIYERKTIFERSEILDVLNTPLDECTTEALVDFNSILGAYINGVEYFLMQLNRVVNKEYLVNINQDIIELIKARFKVQEEINKRIDEE